MTKSSSKPAPVTLDLVPPGRGGLDLYTHEALLEPDRLRVAENVRLQDRAISRRPGAKKIAQIASNSASWTFGSDADFVTVSTAAQLIIPAGGWARRFSFTAVRPAGGDTAYIQASRVPSQSFGVLWATLSDAGVLTVSWRTAGGTTHSIASSAITAGAETHILDVYDPDAGTYTLYVNGTVSGTTITGLADNLKPHQTATSWIFGVEVDPGVGVVADTHFDGKLDSFTLFSLRGTRPSQGTPTLIAALRKWTRQTWPNPMSSMVLAHYDFNDDIGPLIDRSRFKNHGVVTGAPTSTGPVAIRAMPGNYCNLHQRGDGLQANLVAVAGDLFYETIREGN